MHWVFHPLPRWCNRVFPQYLRIVPFMAGAGRGVLGNIDPWRIFHARYAVATLCYQCLNVPVSYLRCAREGFVETLCNCALVGLL